jgi:hypothetical protein
MFKASGVLPPGWSAEENGLVWDEGELSQLEEFANQQGPTPGLGHNGPPRDPGQPEPDPLAGLTKKQIFTDCVWISDEGPTTKLVLLCISRFFDADALASSMAYSQIEAECSLSDRTVKGAVAEVESDDTASATKKAIRKGAQTARERWLLIERQKGCRTASGPQNLYHGIVPERWVAKLRKLRSRGASVEVDERIVKAADAVTSGLKGMKQIHPLPNGVQHVHPLDPRGESGASKGCIRFTLTPITPTKKERERDANASDAITTATEDQTTNQSAGVDRCQSSATSEPSAPRGKPSARPKGVQHVHPLHPRGAHANGKAAMAAALNPEAAERKAYAARNVMVSKSGKVTIGPEFHAELLSEGFTASHIETALANCCRYIEGSDPEKWMKTVRTACAWAKRDDERKGNATRPSKSTGVF